MNTEKITEAIKLQAALDVVNNSVLYGINGDIKWVEKLLPTYTVVESKKKGSIHCKSAFGISDDETWEYIFKAIKNEFSERFQEVFHNTCTNRVDFTIYLKERTGKKECSYCEGTGKTYFSCCGDDVKGTIHEDYGICPTCKEHLSGEHEDCEECNGTGFIAE